MDYFEAALENWSEFISEQIMEVFGMRLEYIVISLVLALIVILIAVTLLTGVVPGVDFILKLLRGAV